MPGSIRLQKCYGQICKLVLLALLSAAIVSCEPMPPGEVQPGGGQAEPGEKVASPIPGAGVPTQLGSPVSGPLKPVGFVNHGSVAATVQVWTYVPLRPDMSTAISTASTVSFPPTAPGLWPNSSRFLSLPLGEYTWCYYWELGDVNDDSMIEYAHAIDNRPVLLDETDSDDLDLAEQVDISAPPGNGEVPGICGQPWTPDIEWGNDGSNWQVDIENGIVIAGRAQGDQVWSAAGGTFDGNSLYVIWQTTELSDCRASMEQWWRVEATTVNHVRTLNGCGTERTDEFGMTRKR